MKAGKTLLAIFVCALAGYGKFIQTSYAMSRPCVDIDADGYGTNVTNKCTWKELDCNDNEPLVNPGINEICYDGIDNNCNGKTDEFCPEKQDVQLRLLFKGTYNSGNQEEIDYLANNYDTYVLVESGNTRVKKIIDANKRSVKLNILFYAKAGGVHGPETRPPNGQSYWQNVVNNRLLWNGVNGNLVKNTEFGWYYVDIISNGNLPKWMDILGTYIADSANPSLYNGIFLDNSLEILPEFFSEIPKNYANEQYYLSIDSLVDYLKHRFASWLVTPNGYAGYVTDGHDGLSLLDGAQDALEGLCFEGAAYKVSGKWWTPERYAQQLAKYYEATTLGNNIIWMDYFDKSDSVRRVMSFASYLLVANKNAIWYPAPTNLSSSSTNVVKAPEMNFIFSKALGKYYSIAPNIYRRDFERAIVIVNYSDTTYKFVGDQNTVVQMSFGVMDSFPAPNNFSIVQIASPVAVDQHSAIILIK